MPKIRKATESDYEAIWEIWMQSHVAQWMSFPPQSKEEFITQYKRLEKASDIYVLVNEEEKVVGVRRIKFGAGHYKHIAEYCSMGIHKDYQGKGYAKLFYEEFEKIAKEAGVKRIQLTQSGGNHAAFHLADTYGFSQEALFPDWLKRSKNGGDYYLIERYVYNIIDDEVAKIANEIPLLTDKYQAVFPDLLQEKDDSIFYRREDNKFFAYFGSKLLFTADLEPDTSVIQHIGFLSIDLNPENYQIDAAAIALREIIQVIMKEQRVKKLELFTPHEEIAKLCQKLGFIIRGEKKASYLEQNEDKTEYKNELGFEYSFFNAEDAKSFVRSHVSEEGKIRDIEQAIINCQKAIESLKLEGKVDDLGANYLENLLYQIIRDKLGVDKTSSLLIKSWKPLLSSLPQEIIPNFEFLQERLKERLNHTHSLFHDNKLSTITAPDAKSPKPGND